jgi:CheY-like chemotaxis protein
MLAIINLAFHDGRRRRNQNPSGAPGDGPSLPLINTARDAADVAFICDENAGCAPAFHRVERSAMVRRRNLILVVDDDLGLLKAVGRLLRQFGYASLLFPSAEAFADHGDFDAVVCVLLDIDLDDGSGIELRYRLKAANVSVPVIYMTGSEDPVVHTDALQSGCLALLKKPFSAKSLRDLLQRASSGLT